MDVLDHEIAGFHEHCLWILGYVCTSDGLREHAGEFEKIQPQIIPTF